MKTREMLYCMGFAALMVLLCLIAESLP